MYESEKSDNSIVPAKPSNKTGLKCPAAESVEERKLAKGNSTRQPRHRTQSRTILQHLLEWMRQKVKGIHTISVIHYLIGTT
ncbi:MAG: hypothetical protein P1V20_08390 [Verrucomicrobiales bacterium]|nr:hypothetical protein [Verrucomicrobiales bacterium]